MRIRIVAVGKLKETYWKGAVAEYQKRLQAYCRLEIIEVADEKTPDQAKEGVVRQIKTKEAARMEKAIQPGDYVIALDIPGKEMDSVQFSKTIEQLGIRGRSNITFLIGGSLGMSEDLLKRVDLRISFSKMTFPHQLMRVILLEQIYRGFRISEGAPYHK